jgi:hypothetical protein
VDLPYCSTWNAGYNVYAALRREKMYFYQELLGVAVTYSMLYLFMSCCKRDTFEYLKLQVSDLIVLSLLLHISLLHAAYVEC